MNITVSQIKDLINLLPEGKNLPHGSSHTFNAVDPEGHIPKGFYSGKCYITFFWSASLNDWYLNIPANE
ncbi:hypothetical protein [Pedobacter rhizosphaerae]|uniref:Uncharacterized protein n=1 Tax=Pedobacter rhizosphaerae TaxID=390241 RepID=A0A1H9VNW4_9SPHI|nr:hypothetical protein [Pedobacter rhizosphaerae]SES23268.1 hypothetical protein SAMN04488023_1464 [Pedobacter rhizosphaerae]